MKSPVLVIGHVTKDLIDGRIRLGGAAAYIAQALSACGKNVALVTRAPNEPLLESLSLDSRIHLHRLPSDTITTFRHHLEKGQRQLNLEACSAEITLNDIPPKWRNLPLVYLVPVSGECGLDLLSGFPESELIVGMQGWLRTVSSSGRIKPSEPPEDLLTTRMLAVSLSVEDHHNASEFALRMSKNCRLVTLTRGEKEITIYDKLGQSNILVKPVQYVRDTTGAGDVFTALLGLRIMAGNSVKIAVSEAAQDTACYVEKGMIALNKIRPSSESHYSNNTVKNRIKALIANSDVPEDPGHADNTLEWLLRMEPNADEALQIAAIAHDIDRATQERIRSEDYPDFDIFKAAHARRGARLLRGILEDCMVERTIIREACRLVEIHEVGGDSRSDLLKDADSISYFDVNLPLYYQRNSWEETARRSIWGYQRLSARAKKIVNKINYDQKELVSLINNIIQI
jgi:sugar/nucleoside kinase (ribokinase family)